MSSSIDRREFLRRAGLGGSAVAAVAAGLPRPAAAQDASLAPFFHGVASGDPLADRVILWTRVTPPADHDGGPVTVRWVVALDPDMTQVVMRSETEASAERDYTVKLDVTGLAAFTYYFYRFEALGGQSLVGRTKTAPARGQGVEHLRLGVASCANYQQGWFNAYARMAERDDIDAIIHTGDYLYEYEDGGYGPGSAIGRGHEPAVETVTLAQYRGRHAQYKQDPDLRRLHQLFPFVVTWDDHESTNNAWKDGAENHSADEGDWARRKADSQQAYAEWMPLRSSGDNAIIYRALEWGDLVDLVVMDTRIEGRDKQVTYPGTDTENLGALGLSVDASDPDRRIISEQQMDFVTARLGASRAQWKLLAQQVILSQWNVGALPRIPEFAQELDFPLILRDGGNAINADAWDGYQADRDRLLGYISQRAIDNVVVLTGDVHSSWAFDLTVDPMNPLVYNPLTGAGSVAVEFVCPGVTSASLGGTLDSIVGGLPLASTAFEASLKALNPQMKYVESTSNGYMVLDITPERCQADWFFVPVDAPDDGQTAGASWAVMDRSNRLVAAAAPAAGKEPAPPVAAATPVASTARSAPAAGGGLGLAGVAAGALAGVLLQRRRRVREEAQQQAAPENREP